jgi:hypothetical protein
MSYRIIYSAIVGDDPGMLNTGNPSVYQHQAIRADLNYR